MGKKDPEEIKIKQMMAPNDNALVYIVRPAGMGRLIKFKVECNGIEIGYTKGKNFIYAILAPGVHKIVSHAENAAELIIKVEAGKTYFIEQNPKMGFGKARNSLNLLDEDIGRKKLAKCSLKQ